MATIGARNPGLLMALAAEGFEPAGMDRVTHPTLKGREFKRAFERAWNAAVAACKTYGEGAVPLCQGGDPECSCLGYSPLGRPWSGGRR